MPYYLAEIRLNRTNKNVRSERKRGKRPIKHLVTILMVFTLIFSLIMIVPAAVGSDGSGQSEVITDLENLRDYISLELPDEAFSKTGPVKGQRNALCNKINAVTHQVEAGAYGGAVNKLKNDIVNAIDGWIMDPWKSALIEEVEDIIDKIVDKVPPVIVDVWREPKKPAYNETVTVKANVTDERSGVKTVILSYSINVVSWVNVTMDLVEELYVGEIPAFPYDTTVYYKIYAYDKAGNSATAGPYSYTVIDPYAPVIGVPTWDPEEPFADEEVKVIVSVSEPADASGIKNVTLWYRTDGEWQSIEMTETTLENWTATIPGQSAGVNVTFYIESYDKAGNSARTQTYKYTLKTPPPGLPPVANFIYSPLAPRVGDVVTFDASSSTPNGGNIVSYEWNFGDNSPIGYGIIVMHIYDRAGTYEVVLNVTDTEGLWDLATDTVRVSAIPPLPDFSIGASRTSLTIQQGSSDSLTITVNSFNSFNQPVDLVVTSALIAGVTSTLSLIQVTPPPNGSVISVLTISVDATATTGIYLLNVTGTSDTLVHSIGIALEIAALPPPNLPPVAEFSESAETVLTGEVISFNASGSYDPDGDIASYFWDFGDGTNATGVTTTHSYADNGTYTVTLTVTDDDDATDSANATKMVENRPPVALFTESAETVSTDETIAFNAGDSYDPDGTITSYSWDFGDGTDATDTTVNHAYEDDGVYTVTLTVTDDDGASSSKSAEKTVEALPGLPWALFAVVGLALAALVATAIYLWYRRRKKRGAASAAATSSKPKTEPAVTLYVPPSILAGYEEERR